MPGTVREKTILLADRAYDPDERHETLARRGVLANIKPLAKGKTKPAHCYPYRRRNFVERNSNKLEQFRAIATRYVKRADNFPTSVQLASLRIWLRT